MFLAPNEYDALIRSYTLNAVKNTSKSLTDMELAAQAEMESYLAGKYHTELIFAPMITWQADQSYQKDVRIIFTAPAFNPSVGYAQTELVTHNSKIYQAREVVTAGIFNPDSWDYLCAENSLFYVVAQNTMPGMLPTSNEYKQGDTRHKLIVLYMIDITLYHIHSNISPQNIPELRSKRYDAAIKWLNMVAKDMLNPGLPLLDNEETSGSFRLGSNDKEADRW